MNLIDQIKSKDLLNSSKVSIPSGQIGDLDAVFDHFLNDDNKENLTILNSVEDAWYLALLQAPRFCENSKGILHHVDFCSDHCELHRSSP